eukprot:365233-Chlamydomonas_euryale.AAC.9
MELQGSTHRGHRGHTQSMDRGDHASRLSDDQQLIVSLILATSSATSHTRAGHRIESTTKPRTRQNKTKAASSGGISTKHGRGCPKCSLNKSEHG